MYIFFFLFCYFFAATFWEITESQEKFLMVMFSNVIYFEEYLMEKGAYYILLFFVHGSGLIHLSLSAGSSFPVWHSMTPNQ